jgi:ABC-2 type transport system permease protein
VSMPAHVHSELPAYRMKGPAATTGDPRRFWNLTWTLASTDFKLRFFGSVLGYVWTLVRPLLFFGVLYAVFSQIVRIGEDVHYYPVLLLSAIVLFMFFSEGTGGAVTSVMDRENLVRKIQFPRMVIPLSTALNATFNLGTNFIAVFFFMAISGVPLRWSWLALPFLLGILLVFVVGIAMLLSGLFVFFRDVRPIWEIVLQGLFYASPVIYPIETVAEKHETLARVMLCNPLATVIQEVRHTLIDPAAPSAADVMGGTVWLLVPAGIVIGAFVLGYTVFNRLAPKIAEEL